VSPGGHLVTTGLLCGAVYALTGSTALTAGAVLGGFLIDVDHAIDYVVLESRRDLRPATFLRHFTEQRHTRLLLALHSYELLALLTALAWLSNSVWVWGYVLGMSLHLPLDVLFNSQRIGLNLAPFYSFVYRARGGFRSDVLLGITAPRPEAGGFWRGFFAEFFPAPVPRAAGVARPLPAGRPIPSSRLAA
jgi:hypothetical protein